MPSYQYLRDIKPEDLKPEEPKELSKKEKRANWWLYHKRWVALGLVVIAVAGWMIYDMVSAVEPDYVIGMVMPYTLPDNLRTKLETGIAAYGEDLNGDGKVVVQVQAFTIATGIGGSGEDANLQIAAITQLSANITIGESILFISSPYEIDYYFDQYQLFGASNGDFVDTSANPRDITVAFQDVPGLAALDLEYTITLEDEVLDGQSVLANYRIGVRPLHDTALEKDKNGPERWAAGKALLDRLMEAA